MDNGISQKKILNALKSIIREIVIRIKRTYQWTFIISLCLTKRDHLLLAGQNNKE